MNGVRLLHASRGLLSGMRLFDNEDHGFEVGELAALEASHCTLHGAPPALLLQRRYVIRSAGMSSDARPKNRTEPPLVAAQETASAQYLPTKA